MSPCPTLRHCGHDKSRIAAFHVPRHWFGQAWVDTLEQGEIGETLAVVLPRFAAPVVGWASNHYGPSWLYVAGFCFVSPLFLVLLYLVVHDSLHQKVLLCVLLALIGVLLACAMPGPIAEIAYIVEVEEKPIWKDGAYAVAPSSVQSGQSTYKRMGQNSVVVETVRFDWRCPMFDLHRKSNNGGQC
ncbi:hypothetical protein DSL72_002981 [Monilinia vaccinii-corymbosi]|uniref:Uncharacterized protein n=1 Tax=Monilinia vaccinii-corymbosi TaxID=61207 RepID=A0A8A3PEA3_9HELO|nr:hypothetical protein DSL72_002981 [Monilinia vaccinii-corymbosi]